MKNIHFIGLLILLLNVLVSAQSEKCSSSINIETGIHSSYLGYEVSEVFHRNGVVQTSVDFKRCENKRTSYGFGIWNSLSVKTNPSSGTEFDIIAFINHKIDEKVSISLDAAVFVLPQKLRIYKARGSFSKKMKLKKNLKATITNSLSLYETNRQAVSGGVVNMVAFDIANSFKHGTLTVTPSVSVDNNPFNLGNGKLVSMGRLYARYDVPLSDKVGFFVLGGVSNKIAGNTFRDFNKVAGLGLNFGF